MTRLLLTCPKKFLRSFSSSLFSFHKPIHFTASVCSFGVTFDPFDFQHHISHGCRTAYLELHTISSTCHYLIVKIMKTLFCTLKLLRMDYCNSLMAGIPKYFVDRLQRIQSKAAHLICRSSRYEHLMPIIRSLFSGWQSLIT